MKNITLTLAIIATCSFASNIQTFGCGITKNAFLTKLNSAYAKKYNIKVTIPGKGGAGKAIKLMGASKVVASSGCRLPVASIKGEENVIATKVAWGALAFIVNQKNPVNNITTAQAKDILTGKISKWSEVGGHKRDIGLYVRKGKNSGVGQTTRIIMFNDKDTEYKNGAKTKGSSGPIRKVVAKKMYAFGVDDIVSASKNKRLKILTLDGIAPTKENIASGKYKLYRPLYIYSNKVRSSENKSFLDFALSSEGQKIISNNGTVNLEEGKKLKVSY